MSVRVLVTGGAGFIGSHTVEELLRQGHVVLVLDDLSTGKSENLEDVVDGLREEGRDPGERLVFVRGDVRDPVAVRELVARADGVIHLAAIPAVPRSVEEPAYTSDVNYIGTINVLEEGRKAGVKRFVCASSSSVYGDSPSLPKREDMDPEPKSPYAAAKYACEIFGRMFQELYPDLNITFLRYFNVFGPRQDPSSGYAAAVPAFVSRIIRNEAPVVFGDGTQSRDFTFVRDAVRANLLALEKGKGVAVYNVARNQRITLLELLDTIYSIAGTRRAQPVFAEPRPGDVLHSEASLDRIAKDLGYRPEFTVEEGLKITLRWYRRRLGR